MKRLLVKICGITNYDDAMCAAEAGADLLGFVLADSARRISMSEAAGVIEKLRNKYRSEIPRMVGVVVDPSLKDLASLSKMASFDLIQVHHPGVQISGFTSIPWYPVLPLAPVQRKNGETEIVDAIREMSQGTAGYVLGDAAVPGMTGGSGIRVSSDAALNAKDLVRQSGKKFILAGGLRSENISVVLSEIAPDGIDASSGLEASPGKKSREKIHQFIRLAREWEKNHG